MEPYKFEASWQSDAGGTKPVNEDCGIVLHSENGAVLVAVADGVGCWAHGEGASTMAVESLRLWWQRLEWTGQPQLDTLMQGLVTCVQKVNASIRRQADKKGIQSGTTLSVWLAAGGAYRILHVGDSRIYRIGEGMGGQIQQLTQDHSVLMPKVINGSTIMKPFLTECLGFKKDCAIQQTEGRCRSGELYLACTDGVYRPIPADEMRKIARRRKNKPNQACGDLIAKARNNGGTDDRTVAVVRIIN